MKKRLLATILVLCMVLGMLPGTAWAADSDFTIENGVLTKYTGPGGDVTIPDSVTYIGDSAFMNCSSLTSVTIPDSVTGIGNDAFLCCSSLTNVIIPDSVTSIGYRAFDGCSSLTSITIPNSVTSIGILAFYGCGLSSITIPNSLTSIGDYVFEYCSSLSSITIPDSVTSIGNGVFKDCHSLTNITIPNSVTNIGNYAFYGCGLSSIIIPNSVIGIGDSAFGWCSNLTSITISNSVTSIGNGAFEYCTSLTDVYYTGNKSQWEAIEIGEYNDCLTSATIHYNGTGEDNDRTATVIIEAGKYTDSNGYGAMPSIPDDGGAAYIPAGADGLILEFTVPTTSDIIFSDDNVMYDGYPNSDLILVDLVEGDCGLRATEAYIYDEHKILSLAFTGTAKPGTLDITFAGFALANAPGQLLTDKDGHLLTSNTLHLVVQGNDTPDETGVRVDFFPNGGTITSIKGFSREQIMQFDPSVPDDILFIDVNSGVAGMMTDENGILSDFPVVERAGYTFDGWWYTDDQDLIYSAYDNEITDFTGMQRVDLSTNFASLADSPNVIAKWNKNSDKSSGDLNGDGKVTMADVLRLARGAAGYVTLTEQERTAGDVTGDGKITMADVIRIARYAAGHSSAL